MKGYLLKKKINDYFDLFKIAKSAAWSSNKRAVLMTNVVSFQNPLAPFCCVLGKNTLRHFSLLGGLGKQF